MGKRAAMGGVVRGEAAAVIGEARATTKHVNVIKESMEAEQSATEEVRVRVAVAKDAPRSVALAVRDALVPVRPHATVSVTSASEASIAGGSWDVVIIVADGSDPSVASAARTFARAGLPVAVVCESALDAPDTGLVGTVGARVTLIVATSTADIGERLANWLVRSTGKGVAMAACFPFARRAEAEVLARECAAQNALIGAFNLVPGSDLPVMAANQVRLAITYATVYGQGVTIARLLEMVTVVGMAATYRNLAKAISLPGLGMLTRAATGYAGTLLTGRALARYYERLDAEGGLGNVATHVARELVYQTASMVSRRLSLPTDLEA